MHLCLIQAVAPHLDALAMQVPRHCGPVDTEPLGQIVDRRSVPVPRAQRGIPPDASTLTSASAVWASTLLIQPVEHRAPVTSAINWAARSTGTCWNTTR